MYQYSSIPIPNIQIVFSTIFSNHGVLGINARNLLYVGPYNPHKAKRLADNKLKTKAFLTTRGIPAAKIYARIEQRDQLMDFNFAQLPDECVLKPNYGFGGEGILVLKGRNKQGHFLKSGKEPITNAQLKEHIEDILDGKFSLGGRRDTPFFEQILEPHDCFAALRPAGLPDIRVIVFNLVPVMAMVRIPTRESEGKANVHLGGIGIGIDIAKGVTTHAVQYHSKIDMLPHGVSPSGIQIPHWDDILLICSRIQQITNIGYLAVDITIDQQMGPAVLEVNARAGLAVQIANLAPLQSRLERVKGLKVSSPEKGVRLGQDLFGEKLGGVEQSEDRPVLGLNERMVIAGDGSSIEEPCHIVPDQDRTTFSPDLIAQLKDIGALEIEDEAEKTYRIKCTLGGKKLQTLIAESSTHADGIRIVVGKRDLSGFLLDPTKQEETASIASSSVKSDLRAVDKLLAQLDRDLLLLKHLKPTNLDMEKERLEQDERYNPLFQYPECATDTEDARKRLEETLCDDSPLGILLEKKRKELLLRIDLIESRGNSEAFTRVSQKLFGKPTAALVRSAHSLLDSREACQLPALPQDMLDAQKAMQRFEDVLNRYSLHNWEVAIRPRLVADVTVGGGKIYIRQDALFDPVRIEALIAHEIETHVLTAENGDHQPYALFRRGCAGYMETQEGLAVYNQNRIYGPHHDTRYNPPRGTLAIQYGLDHSFAETRAYLHEELGYEPQKALTQTISIKRGLTDTSDHGGFSKGLVYLRGLLAIEKYVRKKGDLQRLYIGKINIEDMELLDQIEELQPPLLIPYFLREES